METEYEATFPNVKKPEMRKRLKRAGAKLIRPEFLQKRAVFNLPEFLKNKNSWLRVRDEGDKITMSFKVVDGDGEKIENQKEILLKVDNFEKAKELLTILGCQEKSYQETKRELWKMDGLEITIDQWPFLEPFVEIEGKSEKAVKKGAEKLGFDYQNALFCSTTTLYSRKYNIPENVINNCFPKIVFEMKNPFLDKSTPTQ